MSYMCHATGELVQGEGRELIPQKIRRVVYIGQTKPDKKSGYLQFNGQTEGWEVVLEVPVRMSEADEFKKNFPPVIVEEKEVRYIKPKKRKNKKNIINRDEENDKSGL